jgi:hypothetical protein
MTNLKAYLIWLTLPVIGCASVSEMRRIEQFEQIAHTYELAIRWSEFESASAFLEDQENPALPAQIKHLKQYQVTSYEVTQFLPSADKSQVIVFANVQYFKKSGLIVKNYSHRQLWKYDPEKRNWFLVSGLPDLK